VTLAEAEAFDPSEEIAIIGMAGRFPGAADKDEFWQNLRNGVESISFFSEEELESDYVDPTQLKNPNYVKANAVLDSADLFDAAFFGLSPREAEITDPQQRLLLECAWEVLENAGYDPESYRGLIGIYAGQSMNTYLFNLCSNEDVRKSLDDFQIGIGNDKDFLTTRIAYKLNLKGPCVTVQTACSTSLVAVHLACQSLLDGQCDMALAGGVSLRIPQRSGYLYQPDGISSPDGHCRAFDARAAGCVGGSGMGLVALKRLEDALSDRDNIHAVIKGSAVNNDGSFKIGYTAPSIDGQASVIAEAMAMARISPEQLTYIEAHGTGTALGDPVEVAALTQAFRRSTDKCGFCAVGAVKTNIGHLDAAAGIAGLIKTVLALKNRMIPPSLHFEIPNPQIDFARSPFYVNTKLCEWKTNGGPPCAGVSSFGIGGTNAHVILGAAPAQTVRRQSSRPWHTLVLSTRNSAALERATAQLRETLLRHPGIDLGDVAYTLQLGRKPFAYRRAFVCRDSADAVVALLDPKRALTANEPAKRRDVAFMFPGQGTQHPQMGEELYEHEPVYKEWVDRCAELLQSTAGFDLHEILHPKHERRARANANESIMKTAVAQPALFVVEYALAQMWMAKGVRPCATIGHSIGEYVAAALAGIFSLEDGLRLVTVRGTLMQQCAVGGMLALELDETDSRSRINGTSLRLAAVNAPGRCVVSGPNDALTALERSLRNNGVVSKRLQTSHAFHSEMMRPVVDAFVAEVRRVQLNAPSIPFISNVTGHWIKKEEATDPNYWGRHLLETVRFGDGLAELSKLEDVILLEVGPGRVLSTLAKQQSSERGPLVFPTLSAPGQDESDVASLQKAIGQLWTSGVAISWDQCHGNGMPRRVELPTYPFERQRYWIERGGQFPAAANVVRSHSRRAEMEDWFYVPVWKQSISAGAVPIRKADVMPSYLVLLDRFGIGEELVTALRRHGERAISAVPGEEMKLLGTDRYTFNVEHAEDYQELFRAVGSFEGVFAGIVDLRHLSPRNDSGLTIQAGCNGDNDSFNGLLLLAQALGETMMNRTEKKTSRFNLWVITNDLHAVSGAEQLQPGRATILGPCQVMPLEYPGTSCVNVDIVLPTTDGGREILINQLLGEVLAQRSDSLVAYRGPYRWVRLFEPAPLHRNEDIFRRLRHRGSYLITGGLGGLGLEIAAYLSRRVQARLILVQRGTFPPREDWHQWLASHDAADEISVKIRKLEKIEQNGSECLLLSGDVTKRSELETVLAEATARFGTIHGVIHAAGIAGEGVMQFKSREQSETVLAPKVQGTLLLDELLKDNPLDFLVLCSSLRTIQGGVGLAEYCAANSFLDAFAHYKNAAGENFTTTINWPGWQEVGMSVRAVKRQGLDPVESLRDGLTPDEGTEVLERILQTNLPQVIVCPRDLQQLLADSAPTVDHDQGKQSVNREPAQTTHQRPQLDSQYRAPENAIERTLAQIWQEALGVAQIGLDDNFFELGGDSIISLRIASRASQTGIQLTAKDVFECRTIGELAARASRVQAISVTQQMVTGKVELTPVQHWFFEQHFPEPAHYNQAVLLELRSDVDPSLLEEAWRQLLNHHDVLRLRFVKTTHGWEQSNSGPVDQTTFHQLDLSALLAPDQLKQLQVAASQFQTSLNLEHGPLCRAVYIKRSAPDPARLLLIIHHLAVDAVSWRILLEDLQQATQQLSEHSEVRLPAKTTSFQEWSSRLLSFAQTAEVESDAPYWLAQLEQRPTAIPVDYSNGANLVGSEASLSASLSAAETISLIQQTPLAYQAQINDLLLAALSCALAQWTSERSLLVDIEGHGREPIADDIDVSRTVGWFTNIFPLRLELNRTRRVVAVLTSVKERLRQIPRRGMSYGLGRYLNETEGWRERFCSASRAQIRFLYLGQLDHELSELSFFRLADEAIGPAQNPLGERPYLLDINAYIRDGQFQAVWAYSQSIHERATIERLVSRFISSLQLLIAEAHAPQAQYKSSDFPIADLSQSELDELVASLAKASG